VGALFRGLIGEARVAGLKFHEWDAVAGEVQEGHKLLLRREPENQYDPNAVAVDYRSAALGRTVQIGFVEKNVAASVSAVMAEVPEATYYGLVVIRDDGASEYNRLVVHLMAASEYPDVRMEASDRAKRRDDPYAR
jgi:hypothetical protein